MASCSIAFAQVFVPQTEFSRCAIALWLLQFAVAAGAVLGSGLAIYVKCAGVLTLVIWAGRVRPRRSTAIALSDDGSWALPEHGRTGLQLLPGTRFTRYWATLRLGDDAGAMRSICVWSDTLTGADWRRLVIRLSDQQRRRD